MDLETVYVVLALVAGIAALVFEFIYILRTRRYGSGILLGWGLLILWAILNSLILPWIVSAFNPEYVKWFPRSITIPFMAIGGWAPALDVAAVVFIVQCIIEWLRPSKHKIKEKERGHSTFSYYS